MQTMCPISGGHRRVENRVRSPLGVALMNRNNAALLGQHRSDFRADARAAACYQRALAGEVQIHVPPSSLLRFSLGWSCGVHILAPHVQM